MHLRRMLAWVACVAVTGCGGAGDPGPPTGCDPENMLTDVKNCGTCSHVCPAIPHAPAACIRGQCSRSACDPGWLDLTSEPGCETGGYTPVPEAGLVFAAVTAGGFHDDVAPASPKYRLQGALAEPTPGLGDGAVEARSQGHRNLTGFNAALH